MRMHLAYETIYRIIAGEYEPEDEGFVHQVLSHWEVPHVAALGELGEGGFVSDRQDCNHRFGQMGPLLTEAAARGIPLARAVCDDGVKAAVTGIRMLGRCFAGEEVPVSLIGGVARSAYMSHAIEEKLRGSRNKKHAIVQPSFSAVAGAVLIGFEQMGITVDGSVSLAIAEHPAARYGE